MKKIFWIFLFSVFITFYNHPVCSAALWLNPSWQKRTLININNPGSELTDYQVFIPTRTFTNAQWAEIKGGIGKANLDDVRFTSSDGITLLNYWIDNNTNTPKGFWVKVSPVPAGSSNIYLYYGNASTSAVSNGETVFDFFDNFEAGLAKWTQTKTATTSLISTTTAKAYEGSYSVEVYQQIDNGDTILSYYLSSQNGILEMMFYDDTGIGGAHILGQSNFSLGINTSLGSNYYRYPGWADTGIPRSTKWHTFKFVFSGSSVTAYIDNQYAASTTTVTQVENIRINSGWSVSGAGLYHDLVRIRKYTPSEPTVSAGASETVDTTLPIFYDNEVRHKNKTGFWLELTKWNNQTTVDLKCKAQDTASGLKTNSGLIKYSTDYGYTWSTALTLTSGQEGTSSIETSTAIAIPLVQSVSSTNHPSRIKFIISDVHGNIAESSVYTLMIDTIAPIIPLLYAQYSTVDNTPIQSNVTTQHNTPYFYWQKPDSLSPIIGYSLFISTTDTEPDWLIDTTTTYYEFSAVNSGTYYFRIKAKDEAGNWGNSTSYLYKFALNNNPPQILENNSNTKGISPSASFQITFSKMLDESSLEQAVTLKAVRKNDGTEVSLTIPGTVKYDTNTKTLTFIPSDLLPKGYTFELTISTQAKDTEGNPLTKMFIQKFSTLMDTALENTVIAEDNKTKVLVPAKSLDRDWYITIDTNPTNGHNASIIEQAKQKLVHNFGNLYKPLPETIREFKLYDDKGNLYSEKFKNAVKIFLPYTDNNNDNYVDSPEKEVLVDTLAFWYLDEKHDLWVRIPSTIDKTNKMLSASVAHLSIYTLTGSSGENSDSIYAYPVPWRPNKGQPLKYGTAGEGITFVNLPALCKIKIYNLAGELVKETGQVANQASFPWDGCSTSGEPLTSGTYIYVVEWENGRKIGKLIIIR